MAKLSAAAALVFLAGCASVRQSSDGAVVRVERLDSARLADLADGRHVRSVVHVGGFEAGDPAYRDVRAAAERRGIIWADVALDPVEPEREEMVRLIQLLKDSPRPIALASRQGGDALAFASAVEKLVIEQAPKAEARRELPLHLSQNAPLARWRGYDRFLDEWQDEAHFFASYQVEDRVTAGKR